MNGTSSNRPWTLPHSRRCRALAPADIVVQSKAMCCRVSSKAETVLPGAPLGEFLKCEEVVLSSIAREMFEIFAELIDLNENRRMLA